MQTPNTVVGEVVSVQDEIVPLTEAVTCIPERIEPLNPVKTKLLGAYALAADAHGSVVDSYL